MSYLERNRDWQGLVEELEKGLGGATQNAIEGLDSPEARPRARERSFFRASRR